MIAAKLLDIQGLDLQLVKDAENPHFKAGYATLGAVLDLLRPELQSRNLLLTQTIEGFRLVTTLTDVEDGDFISSAMEIVLDKQTSQGFGSGITYARRYSLTTMFNLDAEDDDGNEASGPKVSKKVVKSDEPKTDDKPKRF
jgi:hypothetical protein